MKIYIAHMSSDGLVSKVIRLGSYLNNYPNVLISHTALILEDKANNRFVFEADISKGVWKKELNLYIEDLKNDNLEIKYTELNFPNNNLEKFSSFLNENYIGSLYSISKSLKSFDLNEVNTNDILDFAQSIIAKKTFNEKYGPFLTYFFKILSYVLPGRFFEKISETRNKARSVINKYNAKIIEKLSSRLSNIFEILNEKDISELRRYINIEQMNKNKKAFYCTEFVLDSIRNWCFLNKIDLPDFLKNEGIISKESSAVYPQELFDVIEKQNKSYILNNI